MRTTVRGYGQNSVAITTCGCQRIIKSNGAILKLWFSSGTIISMRFGVAGYTESWKIKIEYGPIENYILMPCDTESAIWTSDVFSIDEEVVDYQLISSEQEGGC